MTNLDVGLWNHFIFCLVRFLCENRTEALLFYTTHCYLSTCLLLQTKLEINSIYTEKDWTEQSLTYNATYFVKCSSTKYMALQHQKRYLFCKRKVSKLLHSIFITDFKKYLWHFLGNKYKEKSLDKTRNRVKLQSFAKSYKKHQHAKQPWNYAERFEKQLSSSSAKIHWMQLNAWDSKACSWPFTQYCRLLTN